MATSQLNKRLGGAIVSLLLGLATPSTWAQNAPVSNSPFVTCAEQNNITLPQKGSGQQLSLTQRQALHACMRTARKAALSSCTQEYGITLPTKGSGGMLTSNERVELKQCMAAAGFHHWRHFRGRNPNSSVTNPSTPQST